MVLASDPTQSFCSEPGDGGKTSATGLPKRVIRNDVLVTRTCLRRAK